MWEKTLITTRNHKDGIGTSENNAGWNNYERFCAVIAAVSTSCISFMWRNMSCFRLNAVSQTVQFHFASRKWTARSWVNRFDRRPNENPHCPHRYGRSPSCTVRMWASKCVFVWKLNPHRSHGNCLTFLWTICKRKKKSKPRTPKIEQQHK